MSIVAYIQIGLLCWLLTGIVTSITLDQYLHKEVLKGYAKVREKAILSYIERGYSSLKSVPYAQWSEFHKKDFRNHLSRTYKIELKEFDKVQWFFMTIFWPVIWVFYMALGLESLFGALVLKPLRKLKSNRQFHDELKG